MNEPVTSKCPRCGGPVPPGAADPVCPRCAAALLQATQTELTGAPHAGRAFIPPTGADVAPAFPQLEILELLGCGGMGAVYRARQRALDRVVALKILPPGIGDAPAFAERFAREAMALARLNHPGIVTIHDSGRTNGFYYFLMEFVDGVTLRRLLEDGRVSPREALAIVPQICDALQYAHDHGIVHRDIKPENILLDRTGRVKVADFGLAKLVGAESDPASKADPGPASSALTYAGKIMGTPAYMAPEQTDRPGEVDHRADIYALGVVFYQMLTGELPPSPLQSPSKKVRIDVRLDEVVLHALEKEPQRRYQQASQLKTAVETIAATAPGQTAEPQPELAAELAQPAAPQGAEDEAKDRRPRWRFFLAGCLTLISLEFAWFSLERSPVSGEGLLAAAVAIMIAMFFLAAKPWVDVFAVRLSVIFLLLVAFLALAGSSVLPAVMAGVLALSICPLAIRKFRPPRGFLPGFLTVFCLVFAGGVLVTSVMLESFVSTARVNVRLAYAVVVGNSHVPMASPDYERSLVQTECAIAGSGPVLAQVVENLRLDRRWAGRYGHGQPLYTAEARGLLRMRLQLIPVRNTDLFEIKVFDENAAEAAEIANEIAKVYKQNRDKAFESIPLSARPLRIEIVDQAIPGLRPVRPNKPLNWAIAALAGVLLGTAAGAGLATFRKDRGPA